MRSLPSAWARWATPNHPPGCAKRSCDPWTLAGDPGQNVLDGAQAPSVVVRWADWNGGFRHYALPRIKKRLVFFERSTKLTELEYRLWSVSWGATDVGFGTGPSEMSGQFSPCPSSHCLSDSSSRGVALVAAVAGCGGVMTCFVEAVVSDGVLQASTCFRGHQRIWIRWIPAKLIENSRRAAWSNKKATHLRAKWCQIPAVQMLRWTTTTASLDELTGILL